MFLGSLSVHSMPVGTCSIPSHRSGWWLCNLCLGWSLVGGALYWLSEWTWVCCKIALWDLRSWKTFYSWFISMQFHLPCFNCWTGLQYMGISYFNHFLIKGQACYFQSGSSVTALGRASFLHMWRMLWAVFLKVELLSKGCRRFTLWYCQIEHCTYSVSNTRSWGAAVKENDTVYITIHIRTCLNLRLSDTIIL